MTSNNIPDEYPKRERMVYYTIDQVCKMDKQIRIKIAKALYNL